MSRLNKFRALTWEERLLLLEAAILLMLSRVSVRTIPFRHIYGFLNGHWTRDETNLKHCSHDIQSIDRALSRAEELFPSKSFCLPRSIAAYVMLRRRDVPAVIFLGVRSPEDSSLLAAHAWISVEDEPVFQGVSGDEEFTTLVTIGHPLPAVGYVRK